MNGNIIQNIWLNEINSMKLLKHYKKRILLLNHDSIFEIVNHNQKLPQ